MKQVLFLALLTLMGCGVDGPPIKPDAPAIGLSITGRAEVGVAKSW